MNIKRFFIMVFSTLIALTSLCAHASRQDLKEIRLVSDAWHNLTREDGSGLYFDLIRQVYEPLGIKVSISIVPYARSVEMVRLGVADAWVGSFINEQPFPIYPKWHFDRNKQMALYAKKSDVTYKDINSLENKHVIWLRGFNLDKYIPVKVDFHEINDISQSFKMIEYNRADFFVGAESDIAAKIQEEKIDMSKFNLGFVMYLNLYLAFHNDERGQHFCNLWDQQMKKMHNSPEFLAIYARYNYPVPYSE